MIRLVALHISDLPAFGLARVTLPLPERGRQMGQPLGHQYHKHNECNAKNKIAKIAHLFSEVDDDHSQSEHQS
jgi:hypothetical protein